MKIQRAERSMNKEKFCKLISLKIILLKFIYSYDIIKND